MIIALGSERRPKIEAIEGAASMIAGLGLPNWENPQIVTRSVAVDAPAMPTSDEELMRGAASRVTNLISALKEEGLSADLYVGLEGGFHTENVQGHRLVFLRGWAYASDGTNGYFGSSPSIEVPHAVASEVLATGKELGQVIDRIAGQNDIRSKQGTWGVLTRDLLQRRHSFESALLAAFAPFYNPSIFNLE
jgi:inosine/xanthosine triphosphatase